MFKQIYNYFFDKKVIDAPKPEVCNITQHKITFFVKYYEANLRATYRIDFFVEKNAQYEETSKKIKDELQAELENIHKNLDDSKEHYLNIQKSLIIKKTDFISAAIECKDIKNNDQNLTELSFS